MTSLTWVTWLRGGGRGVAMTLMTGISNESKIRGNCISAPASTTSCSKQTSRTFSPLAQPHYSHKPCELASVSCGKMCHTPQGSFYSDCKHMFQAKQDAVRGRGQSWIRRKWIVAMWLQHTERKLDLCVDQHLCIWKKFGLYVCTSRNACALVGFVQFEVSSAWGGWHTQTQVISWQSKFDIQDLIKIYKLF